jgi:hypothetical protein
MRRALIVLGLVAGLSPTSGLAQSTVGRTPSQLRASAELHALSRTAVDSKLPQSGRLVAPKRDYRWEGLVIGAGVVGLAGALLLHGTCEANESCTGPTVSGFALGAVVGGVTGGLIGATIPKKEEE